mgnify:CR=1 FL=1
MQLNHFALLAALGNAAIAAPESETPWSIRMATSIMSRKQGIMTGKGGASELLQAGFVQRALTRLGEQYPGRAAVQSKRYVRDSALSVAPFVLNASHDASGYPLDRLSNGIAMLTIAESHKDVNGTQASELKTAVEALRKSIDLNRRNLFGGLWYYVYPDLSYLDGMFSLLPFTTFYSLNQAHGSSDVNITALIDMQTQMRLLRQHTRNSTTGLLVHGYDASKKAVWANPKTGASPFVWGRSLGWFTMALVDTIELIRLTPKPLSISAASLSIELQVFFRELAPAVASSVDSTTGGWWQIVDQPGREKNYIESSASAMFAYSLLKGARLGLLDHADVSNAKRIGVRAHKYLTDTFIVQNQNGTLGWNGTVAVCSLNSTASYDVSLHA